MINIFIKNLQVKSIILLFLVFLISCNKNHENDNMDIIFNNSSINNTQNPFISFNSNGVLNKITAYPYSNNQRISIGYGSGNIIGTDTCFLHYSCSYLKIIDTNHIEI
ncbi:MAG: hypothetical protein DRI94_14095, partial [Bacteroidetes bacterium]